MSLVSVSTDVVHATAQRVGRSRVSSFEHAAFWLGLVLLVAGLLCWRDVPGALAQAEYVGGLVLHAWVGDLADLERYVVFRPDLAPSTLPAWLMAITTAVVGPSFAHAALLTVSALLLVGIGVAFSLRRTGGRASGWPLSLLLGFLAVGLVTPAAPGLPLALAALGGMVLLWLDRADLLDPVATPLIAVLLLLCMLLVPAVSVIGVAALLAVSVVEAVRQARLFGWRGTLRRLGYNVAALLAACVPAGLVLGRFVQAHGIGLYDFQVPGGGAGNALVVLAERDHVGEMALLALLAAGYALVVSALARARGAVWRREDAFLAVGFLLAVLAMTWAPARAEGPIGFAVIGSAWLFLVSWTCCVSMPRLVRIPAVAAILVIAGMVAGHGLFQTELRQARERDILNMAALIGPGETLLTIADGPDAEQGARAMMFRTATIADAIEINVPSIAAGPATRLLDGNPPLETTLPQAVRSALGLRRDAAEGGGNGLVIDLEALSRHAMQPPEMIALVGSSPGDDAGVPDAYEPVYRSTSGSGLVLYDRARGE